jgi:hypothetical protein
MRLWGVHKKGVYEHPIYHSTHSMTIFALDLGWPYFSIRIQLCYHPQYISQHIFAILFTLNLSICIVYTIILTHSNNHLFALI